MSVTAVRIMACVMRESPYISLSAFERFFTDTPNTSSWLNLQRNQESLRSKLTAGFLTALISSCHMIIFKVILQSILLGLREKTKAQVRDLRLAKLISVSPNLEHE